jgi:hypothetical protein
MEQNAPRKFADVWLRNALHDTDNLSDLVELVAPDLAARLDFSRATYVDRTGPRPDISEPEADVLVLVPTRGGGAPVLCYILLEHQSRPDRSMPLRIMEYATNTWRSAWSNRTHRGQRLEGIMPIVFYTGHDPWRSPPQFEDIIDDGPGSIPAPHWPINYLCLERFAPEDLAADPRPFVNALAIVRAERLDDIERLARIQTAASTRIAELSPSCRDRFLSLMEFVASWITLRLPRRAHGRLLETCFEQIRYDDRENFMTMTRKLGLSYDEELTLAREETRERAQEAEKKGITQGLRGLLLQQIEARFGPVPDPLRQQVEACTDDAALRSAGVQLLSVESANEIRL